MNRFSYRPSINRGERGSMPRCRDRSDVGPSHADLIPTPERLAYLLQEIRDAEEKLAKFQGDLVVSVDQIEPHVANGNPDARLLLDAMLRVSTDRAASLPQSQAV